MKRFILAIALGALTLGLLGSCTQQLDELDRKIEKVEVCDITSIEQQIAAINGSIADLETIRQNIQSLIAADAATGDSLAKLREADAALGVRIGELRTYVDNTLSAYAKVEWANATLATLQQHEWTCDTIAGIDARIGSIDARISKLIEDSKDSLKAWVNTQLGGYYTAAELDAKLGLFKEAIEAASVSGDEKIAQLEAEITKEKNAVDSVKALIRNGYASAVKTAIEQYEGRFTKALSDSIAAVNGKVAELDGRISALELSIAQLTGRVEALEQMIQKVTVVPAYEDGSLLVEKGILTINCIITPKEALEGLTKDNFTVIASQALTKAAKLTSLPVAKDEDLVLDKATGEVTVKVDVSSVLPEDSGKALTVALNVKSGLSDYTTPFSTLTVFAALKTPVVTISPSVVYKGDYTEVVISWNAVENAVKYAITTYDGGTVAIENTSYRILAEEVSKLDIGKYGFSVVAMPDPSSFFADSEAGNDTLSVEKALEGEGTQSSPYLIGSESEMSRLRRVMADGDTTYVKLSADINMSSVENWEPLNWEGSFLKAVDFDGQGHKISNLKSNNRTYTSFFGVLNGTVKNVTFENCTVSANNGYTLGVVAAYGGNAGGTVVGNAINVKCVDCTVTHSFSTLAEKTVLGVGGLFGTVGTGTYRNLEFDGVINNNITLASGSDHRACTGGFCGDLRLGTAVIENVTVKGEINSLKGKYTAGIVGYARNASTKITRCTNEAKITAHNDRVGGICGHFQGGTISECVNTGSVSTTSTGLGGIAGYVEGGSAGSRNTIINCYSTGAITNANGQITGGICGDATQYVDIMYCYATGVTSGIRVVGGIVGRMANNNWNANTESKGNVNSLVSCHVWCPSITHTQTTEGGGSGTIIGYANRWNTYKGCFRAPWYGNNDPNQTALSVANEPNEIPVDQEDCDPEHPITAGIKGTTSARGALSMQHTYPYHGKVSAQQKLTDLIKTLTGDVAWSTDVWNLDGELPTLKNNPVK